MTIDNKHKTEYDDEIEVRERPKSRKPSMFKVYLLNDDFTSMDFVVLILENVFRKSIVEATQIMLHVHKNGKGLAGVYTHEIAETKAGKVRDLAQKQGYPLMCTLEKE